MSKLHISSLLTILLSISLSATAYNVTGIVYDTDNDEPLVSASARIYLTADSAKTAKTFVTDANGRFDRKLDHEGEYAITFSYVGLRDKTVNFSVSRLTPTINLDTIPMNSSVELAEVTVTAQKPLISANGEKMTYSIEDDPQSRASTVLEMLRKVPLVAVDGQDNISVNGQSSFKILINGKENPMMSKNASQILKSMPATSIKKIEVITEPGAKYDAEGVGGILNIITTDGKSIDGYLATITAKGSNQNAGGSIYARSKIKNVTASVSYDYSNTFNDQKSDFSIIRSVGLSPTSPLILMDATQKSTNDWNNGTFDLSWEPDTLNLFNISASLMKLTGDNSVDMLQSMVNSDLTPMWSYHQFNDGDWSWGSVSAQASYQHTFRKPGHTLVASYLYTHGISKSNSLHHNYDAVDYMMPLPAYQRIVSDNPTNEHTLQIDYTNPINGHHTIETGAKAIFRRDSSKSNNLEGETAGDLASTSHVDMRQHQDVTAVYASYSGTYGKWLAKAGVRYEHTRMGIDMLSGQYPGYTSSFDDIVPNAAVGYTFSPANTLRLSYQMRISRPNVSQLNPFKDESNPLEISMGNPDLQSEKNHSLTLTYSNFLNPVGINISSGYTFTDNAINQYSYNEGTTFYNTYANIGHQQSVFINTYLNFNIFKKLTWSIYGSATYRHIEAPSQGLRHAGWEGMFNVNLNYTMPWDIRASINGGGGVMGVGLQSSATSMFHYYMLSLTKGFLADKRLEVSLQAANFFAPMKMNIHSWTADSRTDLHLKARNMVVGVNISYRLGSLSTDVKKVVKEIVNDDRQGSSRGGSSTNIGGM